MRRLSTLRLAASLAVLGTSGCTDFLSSDKVKADPNNPSSATADQLFVAVQAGQFAQQEGIIPLIACMWLQQCTGVSNFLETLESYDITSEDVASPAFSALYEGGGLVDIRQIIAAKAASSDRQYLGIAQVWEVLTMALAADIYGDIPYRQALTAGTPTLDSQAQVYSDLQGLLDQAITNLGGAGPGPGVLDLVYGGNTTKWIEAANTVKARLYLHTAELPTAGTFDAGALNNAITSALLGISTPANDFKTRHGSDPGQDNMWYQFKFRSGFGDYVVAGRALVDLMVRRDDPRLPEYFNRLTVAPWQAGRAYAVGAVVSDANGDVQQATNAGTSGSGEPVWATAFDATTTDNTIVWRNVGQPYGGTDPSGGNSPAGISLLEGTRNAPTFSQPLVTYIENELILAEAYYRLGQTANAQTHFDNARASVPGLAAKPIASIDDIMEEKYIAMFQNAEVWNDYKRSCYPPITPVANPSFDDKVPGRLFYGTTEENANPNIPSRNVQLQRGGNAVSTPPANPGFRNPNDPNPC
jgi:starch-binding outer membrane protein, SusD/RagB family